MIIEETERKIILNLIPPEEARLFLQEWGVFVDKRRMSSCIIEAVSAGYYASQDKDNWVIRLFRDPKERIHCCVEKLFGPNCRRPRRASKYHTAPWRLSYVIDFKNKIFKRDGGY